MSRIRRGMFAIGIFRTAAPRNNVTVDHPVDDSAWDGFSPILQGPAYDDGDMPVSILGPYALIERQSTT